MKDQAKTKKQLIEELEALHKQLAVTERREDKLNRTVKALQMIIF